MKRPSATAIEAGFVGMLIVIAALGVVMGTLAAILPARRAAGLDPLQALTYE